MPFKSSRLCYLSYSALCALAFIPQAYATLTITPTVGGERVENTIYLAVKYSKSGTGKSVGVDPTKSVVPDVSDADTLAAFNKPGEFFSRLGTSGDFTYRVPNVGVGKSSDPNLTQTFNIRVSGSEAYTPASGETLILVAYVTVGSSKRYVPISGYSTSVCNDTDCVRKSGDATYFYGVKIGSDNKTLSNLQLAFHIKDICTVTDHDACDTLAADATEVSEGRAETGKTILPDASDPEKSIDITIAVRAMTNGVVPETTATDKDSLQLTFNFQSKSSTMICPSAETLGNAYFPGDGEVFLNTSVFSLQPETSLAPLSAVVVIKSESPAVPSSTAYYYVAGLDAIETAASTDAVFTGFTNSTASVTHDYNLLFGVRDRAGLISFDTDTTCTLGGVRASSVQSFLKKSKCFIATASFQSMDAAPVEMLRDFRDSILLKSTLGQRFVNWYYAWSEPTAAWVMDHPWIRFPILLMLVPVQASVWFAMNYRAFLGLLLIVGFGAIIVYFSTRKQNPGTDTGVTE